MIYIILLGILVILMIAVVIFPAKNQSEKLIQPANPTPTTVEIAPSLPSNPSTPLPTIMPTDTGASEEVPAAMKDLSTQKQNLRRKTPFKQAAFTIAFDYTNDNFIVTVTEPKAVNQQTFSVWLKQNYPLLPLSQFVLQ